MTDNSTGQVVPDEGAATPCQRYNTVAVGFLEVDTSHPESVGFYAVDRMDQASVDVRRETVERVYAQLGVWLRIDPPVGNLPCSTCGEYDPYDCTCPDRDRP